MAGRRIYLEVIKGGVVIETLTLIAEADVKQELEQASPLLKEFLIGRDADLCDLPFLHGSISRKHATLFCEIVNQSGQPFLSFIKIKDLNSSNGSFVNKRKVSGLQPLNPGDVLRFGESTRLYHVVSDFQPVPKGINVEQTLQQAGYAPEKNQEAPRKVAELSAKEKKLRAKLEAKKSKIAKIETECQRIEAKESAQGELTEGQANQLQKNRERLEELKEEVEQLSEELELEGERRAEGLERKHTAENSRKRKFRAKNDDEDEFYDRTIAAKKTQPAGSGGGADVVETEQTLSVKVAAKEAEVAGLLEQKKTLMSQLEQDTDAAVDELDKFMLANKQEAQQSALKKCEQTLNLAEKELSRLQALLEIARPAISSSTATKPVVSSVPPVAPQISQPTKPIAEAVGVRATDKTSKMGPPAPGIKEASKGSEGVKKDTRTETKKEFLEKLKRKRERALKERDRKEAAREKEEEEDAVFTPPVNQTGDGVTRLNAKYGY